MLQRKNLVNKNISYFDFGNVVGVFWKCWFPVDTGVHVSTIFLYYKLDYFYEEYKLFDGN